MSDSQRQGCPDQRHWELKDRDGAVTEILWCAFFREEMRKGYKVLPFEGDISGTWGSDVSTGTA